MFARDAWTWIGAARECGRVPIVVGGTGLSGGSGRILGTLIGAFIISVIKNGMILLGIESYTQNVVLGFVILGAVLLDKLRGRTPWLLLAPRK